MPANDVPSPGVLESMAVCNERALLPPKAEGVMLPLDTSRENTITCNVPQAHRPTMAAGVGENMVL